LIKTVTLRDGDQSQAAEATKERLGVMVKMQMLQSAVVDTVFRSIAVGEEL
jgi:hypothetical protein